MHKHFHAHTHKQAHTPTRAPPRPLTPVRLSHRQRRGQLFLFPAIHRRVTGRNVQLHASRDAGQVGAGSYALVLFQLKRFKTPDPLTSDPPLPSPQVASAFPDPEVLLPAPSAASVGPGARQRGGVSPVPLPPGPDPVAQFAHLFPQHPAQLRPAGGSLGLAPALPLRKPPPVLRATL